MTDHGAGVMTEPLTVEIEGRMMIVTADDGRRFEVVSDGSYVAGPGHDQIVVDGDEDICAACADVWPCESAELSTIWFEDESRPDDAVELYRLRPIDGGTSVRAAAQAVIDYMDGRLVGTLLGVHDDLRRALALLDAEDAS